MSDRIHSSLSMQPVTHTAQVIQAPPTSQQLRTQQDAPGPVRAQDHKFFGLPELLYMVLLELDIFDLMRVERVCKGFNHAIDTSRRLQVTLFRTADNEPAVSKSQLFNCTCDGDSLHHSRSCPQRVAFQTLHPFLQASPKELPRFTFAQQLSPRIDMLSQALQRSMERRPFVPRPESLWRLRAGSWPNMLVRHPPYTKLCVIVSWRSCPVTGLIWKAYEANEVKGMTFGDIVDGLELGRWRGRKRWYSTEEQYRLMDESEDWIEQNRYTGLQSMLENTAIGVAKDRDHYSIHNISILYDRWPRTEAAAATAEH